jgi:hypothetical protein
MSFHFIFIIIFEKVIRGLGIIMEEMIRPNKLNNLFSSNLHQGDFIYLSELY